MKLWLEQIIRITGLVCQNLQHGAGRSFTERAFGMYHGCEVQVAGGDEGVVVADDGEIVGYGEAFLIQKGDEPGCGHVVAAEGRGAGLELLHQRILMVFKIVGIMVAFKAPEHAVFLKRNGVPVQCA